MCKFLSILSRALHIPILRGSVHKQLASEKLLVVLDLRYLEYFLLLKILLHEILNGGVLPQWLLGGMLHKTHLFILSVFIAASH